jgi:Nucleotide-diphospho-sugar transferase
LADPDPAPQGFVYAATGADYVTLARRSARALRRVEPQARIDLFTDQPLDDPVFDRIVPLDQASRRPKMEALRRSRFARSLYLDADVIPLAPLSPLFALLDRFDLGLTIEMRHNDLRNSLHLPGVPVPEAFPTMNSGVFLCRATPETQAFLADWQSRTHDGTHKIDQRLLRALLFQSRLQIATLPPEWNVMWVAAHLAAGPGFPAPRLVHLPHLHEQPPGDPLQPLTVSEALPPDEAHRLAAMFTADLSLGEPPDQGAGTHVAPPRLRRLLRWLRIRLQGPI